MSTVLPLSTTRRTELTTLSMDEKQLSSSAHLLSAVCFSAARGPTAALLLLLGTGAGRGKDSLVTGLAFDLSASCRT
jgi:hypothetical protein